MNKYRNIYIVMNYVVFLVLFCIVGAVNTFVTDNRAVLQVLKTILAWTSFFVLLVMFKKLMPDKTFGQFVKGMFAQKLDLKIFSSIFAVSLIIFILSVYAASVISDTTFSSLFNISFKSVAGGFFVQLVSGPIGEEPGYRGYLFPELTKKHSIIMSGLIVGLLWGFWHFPLWIITGYKGAQLIIYSVCFLISIVCACVVMCITYSINKNILNCILIHQMVNFTVSSLYTGDILAVIIPMAIQYLICTAVICFIFIKKQKK
ncbi:MAG: type II CAAX endopeptidase family protein [Oscillospiraceae bacterium]|nr:type II CAAX endopeptidase family protein [Oscillospiraceae bacterium]